MIKRSSKKEKHREKLFLNNRIDSMTVKEKKKLLFFSLLLLLFFFLRRWIELEQRRHLIKNRKNNMRWTYSHQHWDAWTRSFSHSQSFFFSSNDFFGREKKEEGKEKENVRSGEFSVAATRLNEFRQSVEKKKKKEKKHVDERKRRENHQHNYHATELPSFEWLSWVNFVALWQTMFIILKNLSWRMSMIEQTGKREEKGERERRETNEYLRLSVH